MHLWISEIFYLLLDSFLQLLNADFFLPSFELEQAVRSFLPKPVPVTSAEGKILSLNLACKALHTS